jgi:sulfite reductase (ferredoxin)
MINAAKALLLLEDKTTNTHAGIITQFDEFFVDTGLLDLGVSFSELVYQIQRHEPSDGFALSYIENAENFLKRVRIFRNDDELSKKTT